MIDLQRSEVLSLDRFLHLPVSLKGAFLINYIASLFSVTLVVFAPFMTTFAIGQALSRGPLMLLVLPLLVAFFLMVTTLTYQFQGWLASLMSNQRRRRTVIVVVTAAFILLCQIPNLVNLLNLRRLPQANDIIARTAREKQEQEELNESFQQHKITVDEYVKRSKEIRDKDDDLFNKEKALSERRFAATVRLINSFLPPGWLPLGAEGAAQGTAWPALLGTLGMTSIGAFSLWRSYRTTLRLYTGVFTAGKRRPVAVAAAAPPKRGKPSVGLLEWQVPWVSEQVSAIAVAGFRSLLRAPEVKMLLLTPVILIVVFGSFFVVKSVDLPEMVRPLPAYGAMSMILVNLTQLVGNQFGFDRGGFRVFVLSSAPRRDIIVGKNLAIAPFAVVMSTLLIALVAVVLPMRLEHLLAMLPQLVAMFLLFCLLANCMSILTPMPVRSGALRPVNPKGTALLIQLAFFFLFPLIWVPTLLPLGVEVAVEQLTDIRGIPICLLLTVVGCALVIIVYRVVVTWQGAWLQRREQKILEVVTSKLE
jgi:ABC-2 type transport system permease protein